MSSIESLLCISFKNFLYCWYLPIDISEIVPPVVEPLWMEPSWGLLRVELRARYILKSSEG